MTRMGKGLLLAASTRDDELTALAGARAAHRLPVANRPLLSYGLAAMQASGVEDVAVIVSPGTAADVRAPARRQHGRRDADRLPRRGRAPGPRARASRRDPLPRRPPRDGPPRRRAHLAAAAAALRRARARRRATRSSWCATPPSSAGSRRHAGVRPLRLVEDKPVPPAEQALAGVFVLGPAAIDAALALPDEAGVTEIVRAIGDTAAGSRRGSSTARGSTRARSTACSPRTGWSSTRSSPTSPAATSRRRASRAGSRSTPPP